MSRRNIFRNNKKPKLKLLKGSDIAEYIKVNQVRQVRFIKQRLGREPNLHIIVAIENNLPIEKYIQFKQAYGDDIGVEVKIHRTNSDQLPGLIDELNSDDDVDAIILQLPIKDASLTEQALNSIAPEKDVDGLGENSNYEPATALAIMWLLSGYNIDLKTKKIFLVGKGKLVGGPLSLIFDNSGVEYQIIGRNDDLSLVKEGNLIISATGQPGLITSDLIQPGAIFVDAGTVGEDGVIKGDGSDELYERQDISITPKLGGVGPLTISALFGNVLIAVESKIKQNQGNQK